ncbi:MAG: YdcH family protein [Thiomonas sp.]|uniref:Protein containing DUF465 n=1 Tax=mine drainage metagenome TaxID=410659 RepID=E6PQY9_9ZZZZ
MWMDHHDLLREFPEEAKAIVALRERNGHFDALCARFDAVSAEIVRIERGKESASDAQLHTLRLDRLKLKDEIVALLRQG